MRSRWTILGVICMIGLPTVNGPVVTGGLPRAAIPTVIAPQLNVQQPLRPQLLATAAQNLLNPYKMRVWQNALQNIAAGATATVAFDSVTYDTLSGFNATTHQWTVPVNGYYQVNVVLNPTTPAAAQTWIANIWFDTTQFFASSGGSFLGQGPYLAMTTGALGNVMGVEFNDIQFLHAGDNAYIIFGGLPNVAGNFQLGGFNYAFFWSMHLVST